MPIVVASIQGLTAERATALRRLCEQAHVALAVIFGSRARGEATATSDLDLLVLPAFAAPFDLLGFESAAQQIVGGLRVDLTLLRPGLSSTLAWEALREAVVLWEATPCIYDHEVAIWRSRFQADAPRRREQALQLAHMFECP